MQLQDARFRALVEHSSDILAIVSDDGRWIYVNPATHAVLGHAPDALQGQRLDELVHPDDHASLHEVLAGADSAEIRFRDADGHWVYLDSQTRRPEGDGAEGIVLDARDVTARHRALAALAEEEQRYRELFESSRDAICIGTLEGRLVDVNPAAVELFGYDSKEEMLELDIARDLYWNSEDRKRAEAVFLAQGFVDGYEHELRTKQGRRIRVQETATAIRDTEGEVIGFRGVLRDTTEQIRLQEQLRQSQKMEAVGRLAGGVAHDFNNLLTAINGYAELALARMSDDDAQRQAVEEIRKAGKRATDLTRRLLTLSRHQTVSPRRIDLNQCVYDMEKLLQRVIGEDIRLDTRLGSDLPRIIADQGQIEQIILNLAVNARDAMPDGGSLELETRRVRMPAEAGDLPRLPVAGEYVLLRVADTGSGMEQKVREHAFEPFFTTKGKGHNTGLGLAIVYGIVKQAGGYIEVESSEGEGTTFLLFFPLQSQATASLPDLQLSADQPLPRGSETVLLVEDETSVRALVRQILELQGYDVLAARNAQAAEAICDERDSPPDLLLTDVVMPGRSGLALAEDLKQRFADLRILFMSGYTDSHNGVKLLTQQQAAFLAKPFSPEVLARKVRDVLDA
ncbi:MAG: PAS domain S-box protein [Acidobacteriota bacterium]